MLYKVRVHADSADITILFLYKTYNIFNIVVFQLLLLFTRLLLKIRGSVLAHNRINFSKYLPLSFTFNHFFFTSKMHLFHTEKWL